MSEFLKNAPLACDLEVYSVTNNPNLMNVKLRIMHDGENRKTKVTKEALLDAEDSLRNVPIMAKILDDGSDFNEHDMKLEKVNGKYKIKYLEKAIGVVGYDSDITYTEEGDTTYVNATGYIWTRYNQDAVDIIKESDQKGISMEIKIEDGYMDEESGLFTVTKFIFTGITVLGDHIESAMYDTYLETYSVSDDLKNQITEMCNEIYSLNKEKEVDDLMAKKIENPIEDKEIVEDETVEDIKEDDIVEDKKDDDVENPIEDEKNPEDKSDENDESKDDNEPEEDEKQIDPNEQYSMSMDDIRISINKLLDNETVEMDSWGEKYTVRKYWMWDILPMDKIVILEDSQSWGTFYGVPFEYNNDDITLDLTMMKPYIREWREKVEGDNLEVYSNTNEIQKLVNETYSNQKAKIEELTDEISKLEVYKAEKDKEELKAQVEEVAGEFSELEESEISTVKQEVIDGNMDMEQFEKELYCMVGMKSKKSKETYSNDKKPESVGMLDLETYSYSDEKDEYEPYGNVFKKYGIVK